MTYIILHYNTKKKKWIATYRIRTSGNHRSAFAMLRKQYGKRLNGDFWIFPVSHSRLYSFKKGKYTKKAVPFYKQTKS